jgi:hypothetical protein
MMAGHSRAAVERPELRADRSALASIFELVDELEVEATGRFVFLGSDAHPVGALFVEGGRICWAAAEGLAQRLTTLLIARSAGALTRSRVEALVRECHASGKPLGERLVELQLVDADALRTTLLEHTTESIVALAARAPKARWSRRDGAGYNPRFTFSTAEVFAQLGAATFPEAREAARRATEAVDAHAVVAAYVRTPELADPCPVLLQNATTFSARELIELGRWMAAMLDLSDAIAGTTRLVGAARHDGTGLVVWRNGSLLLCAIPPDHLGFGRSISRVAAMR